MFTVKHVKTDGSETLHTAERVDVLDPEDRFSGGIFLDLRDSPSLNTSVRQKVDGLIEPREFKAVIHFVDARSADDVTPMCYVMNRYGATVATYRL